MAATLDEYASKHPTVQAEDLDWCLDQLSCYGSFFLEAQTTISYDDKAAGTDRVLPTSGATSYTGGLSVHKYIINIVARNKRGIKTRGPRDKKHSAA